jgi:hypothetical protein
MGQAQDYGDVFIPLEWQKELNAELLRESAVLENFLLHGFPVLKKRSWLRRKYLHLKYLWRENHPIITTNKRAERRWGEW